MREYTSALDKFRQQKLLIHVVVYGDDKQALISKKQGKTSHHFGIEFLN